jgi:GrpB-like predicted nucleotidyltransferase (UPF0157 family)
MEPSSPRWEELILIRDYLRQHPETASQYAGLKRAFALQYGDDIAGYRDAKRPFLESVMVQARAERESAR